MSQTISFLIAFVCYTTSIGIAVFRPKPYAIKCAEDARIRGWSNWIIILTRATQHFTLYALMMVVLATYTDNHELSVIAASLECLMFVLYHMICFIDPNYLGYDNPDLIRECARLRPPLNRYFIVWLGLHFQHTIVPIVMMQNLKYHEPEDWIYVMIALMVYIQWNHFCWKVQGLPAYPIQNILYAFHPNIYYSSLFLCIVLCYTITNTIDGHY